MDNITKNSTIREIIEGYKILLKNFFIDDELVEYITPAVEQLRKEESHSITWVGHSTFLIQLNGINILTDPVWSNYVGVTKRSRKVPIRIDQLPKIDIILISHGHFDHLDFPTLKKIKAHHPLILVPAGLKSLFLRRGFREDDVYEKNWWENHLFKGLNFNFVPAQHWFRRGLFDGNISHWGGWVIQSNDTAVYFAGDSGYFRGFREIGEHFPDIDYALLPIGAYAPEWFNEIDHLNPEEAVSVFMELEADFFIPMHYGTFRLGDDTGKEALKRLNNAWTENKIDDSRKKVLPIGGTIWL